jgi:hypothetical protein
MSYRALIAGFVLVVAGACGDEGFEDQPGLDAGAEVDTDAGPDTPTLPFALVDTAQDECYDDATQVTCPASGAAFSGQDAQYAGAAPSYVDNGDGTVTDLVTGLTWAQSLGDKVTFQQALDGAADVSLGGHTDWRVPTIKEQYSLIDFRGGFHITALESVPYIDTDYFEFAYGDESAGERPIDVQVWTSTEYVSTTMHGDATVFGVNFADGRIKGYPRDVTPGGSGANELFVRYVRGNVDYGVNDFVAGDDGTVTDGATDLVWQQGDSTDELSWRDALAYCEELELGGATDWRLPDAKQLQSVVDYSRAPAETGSAAIDPIFDVTEEESYFWTSTTHLDGPVDSMGVAAVYVTFGRALGYMESPPGSGTYELLDVHGAGAQRSDPKTGDPADYPNGHGPQGDDIRIYNFARCVRPVSEE